MVPSGYCMWIYQLNLELSQENQLKKNALDPLEAVLHVQVHDLILSIYECIQAGIEWPSSSMGSKKVIRQLPSVI
jgi:hypothetical protein